MTTALIFRLMVVGLFQASGQQSPNDPADMLVWFGKPLRSGTVAEYEKYVDATARARLQPAELAALEKLKAVGFLVKDRGAYPFVVKDGKRYEPNDFPPLGIVLAYSPERLKPRPPPPTAKELEPLAEVRHVERLFFQGRVVEDSTLGLLRGMDVLSHLYLMEARISDVGLHELAHLKMLRVLELVGTGVGDAGLATLGTFPALESLGLQDTKVSDAGLKVLARNAPLTKLSLSRTAVGDVGLAVLGSMSRLKSLGLEKTRVTDKGLAEMAKPGAFPDLRALYLGMTRVSDTGLKHLHDPKVLPALATLNLRKTDVTAEGVAALQKARPELKIDTR
jgi:hypothetical protein